MNTVDIYQKFGIPENLQEHMLRVTKVAMMIVDGWKGEGLDKELIKRAALVHDLANIVKFKLDDDSPLKAKQVEAIAKYGADDHIATEKMLRELGMDEQVIHVVQNKSFGNAVEVAGSDNWPLKILFYSDMRVIPTGVVALETRLNDVVTRLEKYKNHPLKDQLLHNARMVEKQIQSMTTVNLQDLNDDLVSKNLHDLLSTPLNSKTRF